jgi:DNA-binding CsgD family transcriptional regulator
MYGSSKVDAAPVVAKVQQLVAEGYPRSAIAKAANISARNLSERTLNGRTTVTKKTSDAVLGLTRMEIIHQANPESLMPSIGAARRLRALMAMGWRLQDLATTTSEFHLYNSIRSQHDNRVRVDSHLLIANLYDKYSMRKGPSQLNVAKSKRLGYAPPLAWDEDALDNPDARPDTGDPKDTAEQRQLERLALWRKGLTDREIAAATGRHHDAIRRWRVRHGLPHGRRTA